MYLRIVFRIYGVNKMVNYAINTSILIEIERNGI